jgi:hypothetical protein
MKSKNIIDESDEENSSDEVENLSEKHSIIYKIINELNGKIFIGFTSNSKIYKGNNINWTANLEFNEHKKNLKRKTKNDLEPLLYQAMMNDGVNNFTCETLEKCETDEVEDIYYDYIVKFNSDDADIGYNLHRGEGLVYLITNNKNGKLYVGQTKTLKNIKGRIKLWTVEDRLDEHKKNSARKSKSHEIKSLYEAIINDGPDNFTIEELLRCSLEEVGFYEQHFIEELNTRDNKIGYNINAGGNVNHSIKGNKRNVVVTDELRSKLSKTKNEHPNITEFKKDDKILGYRVRIVFEGVSHEKRFTNQDYTLEENFEKAQEFLRKIKNKEDLSEYKANNKSNDFPLNIFPKSKKGKHIGFEVNITINKVKHTKSFCSLKIPMEEKLKMAIEYKEEILKNSFTV